MSHRRKVLLGTLTCAAVVFAAVAALQARAVDAKARGLRPGMSVSDVMQQLEGWRTINAHPVDSRAIPHGTGPEFNGYSGELYVLTPVLPDGRETDTRKMSRGDFVARLDALVSSGTPWTVYFSYRTVPTHRGILVRFDGNGRVVRAPQPRGT